MGKKIIREVKDLISASSLIPCIVGTLRGMLFGGEIPNARLALKATH